MDNITQKIDDGNDIEAEEMKQICGEEQNLILSTGMSLSASDLGQIAKAVAAYSSRGDYYTDIGTANAINLSPVGIMKYPQDITVGTRVRFIPKYNANSTAVTMRIAGVNQYPVSSYQMNNGQTALVTRPMLAGKVYRAVLTQTPDGLTTYWLLYCMVDAEFFLPQSIGDYAIKTGAITTSKIQDGDITTDKYANISVTNAKIASDLSLSKINNGVMSFSEVEMSGTGLQYGIDSEPNTIHEKQGIKFSGTGSPGGITPFIRFATYNIKNAVAASSIADALTRTASSHSHRIGQQYVFATNFQTNIPNAATIIGATLSYTEITTGRKIAGAPVILTMETGSTTLEVLGISIAHVKDAAVDYPINTSYNIILSIIYDGTVL